MPQPTVKVGHKGRYTRGHSLLCGLFRTFLRRRRKVPAVGMTRYRERQGKL